MTKARQDIRALEAALNLYKLDNYVYPTTDQGLEALVEKPSSPEPANWKEGGYVDRLPLDPWKQPYQYLSPGGHGTIDIYSLGPDQTPSEDDVGNWELHRDSQSIQVPFGSSPEYATRPSLREAGCE
jgi:general secretion pathway protein G